MNRVLLLTFSVALVAIVKSAAQNYTIERKFGAFSDSFTIPTEKCNTISSSNKCSDYGASKPRDAQNPCQCQCSATNSGFLDIQRNGSRKCVAEETIRRQEGCGILLLFDEPTDRLSIIQGDHYADQLKFTPSTGNCELDVEGSRYLECDGTWAPISSNGNSRFDVRRQSDGTFLVWVEKAPNSPNLDGRVIKLAVTCNPQGAPAELTTPCILFKLHGTIQCPAQVPPEPTTATTTIPQTTSGEQVDSTTAISTTPNEQPTTKESVGEGARQDDRSSIVPLAFGLGVLGVIIIVVLCIVLVILMNRRKATKENKRIYDLRKVSAQEEIARRTESSTTQVGLNMYGDNLDKHDEEKGTGTIYLNAKAREAKIEEEKHKKSMGKTNEYYEGDSAYNTIRRLDSPTASEGGGFDHRHYSIPRKADHDLNLDHKSDNEVIEAEFRLSAEIPPVYDVPDPNSNSDNTDLEDLINSFPAPPRHYYDVPEAKDQEDPSTSTPKPVDTSPPLRLTVKATHHQPYVPIVVLDNKNQQPANENYDTPEQVIDLQNQYLV